MFNFARWRVCSDHAELIQCGGGGYFARPLPISPRLYPVLSVAVVLHWRHLHFRVPPLLCPLGRMARPQEGQGGPISEESGLPGFSCSLSMIMPFVDQNTQTHHLQIRETSAVHQLSP